MPLKLEIVRCDPDLDRVVFDLATQAWPAAEREGYELAIRRELEGGNPDRVVLLGARCDHKLVAGQLGQALPGRVAVVWRPWFTSNDTAENDALAESLFSRQTSELAAAGVPLCQGLVVPGDAQSAHLFACGGFSWTAELLYLAAPPKDGEVGSSLPFELAPLASSDDAQLAELIDRTYVGTLDCPSLDGMRATADVIAGYRAVGCYLPDLWYLVRHEGQLVGCLLLNVHPDVKHAEIVYLALTPEARGRGWGLLLAWYARWAAAQANCEQVVLAVDATNRPALALYEQAGFKVFDRREIWIKQVATKPQNVST